MPYVHPLYALSHPLTFISHPQSGPHFDPSLPPRASVLASPPFSADPKNIRREFLRLPLSTQTVPGMRGRKYKFLHREAACPSTTTTVDKDQHQHQHQHQHQGLGLGLRADTPKSLATMVTDITSPPTCSMHNGHGAKTFYMGGPHAGFISTDTGNHVGRVEADGDATVMQQNAAPTAHFASTKVRTTACCMLHVCVLSFG